MSLELDSIGSIISYEEYHPHGTTAWQAPELATLSLKRYRYTGMERDPESGLQCHGRRYYVAWLGRWLSADPIGVGDGVNRYAYVHGDPVGGRDGSGLQDASSVEDSRLRPGTVVGAMVTSPEAAYARASIEKFGDVARAHGYSTLRIDIVAAAIERRVHVHQTRGAFHDAVGARSTKTAEREMTREHFRKHGSLPGGAALAEIQRQARDDGVSARARSESTGAVGQYDIQTRSIDVVGGLPPDTTGHEVAHSVMEPGVISELDRLGIEFPRLRQLVEGLTEHVTREILEPYTGSPGAGGHPGRRYASFSAYEEEVELVGSVLEAPLVEKEDLLSFYLTGAMSPALEVAAQNYWTRDVEQPL